MSALAHWFEQAGLHTVVIGLIKPHLETMRPPRALWVPFELGRPLGPPGDQAFQKRVLLAALTLIETATKQTLIDFEDDDPRGTPDPDWRAPATGAATSVASELSHLQPAITSFKEAFGRSSVGVAGLDLSQCASLVDETLATGKPPASADGGSALLQFRHACDDLKAAWIEAALANGKPSSRQLHDWFWLHSQLGLSLRKLREQWLAGDDEKLAGIGARFIVPHRWRV